MTLKDFNNMTLEERQEFLRKRGAFPIQKKYKPVENPNGWDYLRLYMLRQWRAEQYTIIGPRSVK